MQNPFVADGYIRSRELGMPIKIEFRVVILIRAMMLMTASTKTSEDGVKNREIDNDDVV